MFSKSQTKNMSTVSELHSWQRKSIGFNSRLTTESSLVFICSHPPLPSRQMKLLCPDLSTLNITIWLTAPPTRATTHLYLRLVYLLHHIHINISNSGTSFFFRYRIFLCILAKSLCHYNYIPFIFISMTYNDELSHSMNFMKTTY